MDCGTHSRQVESIPSLSKDYELLPEMSEAMIYGAMIHTMLCRLAKLKKQA